MCGRYSLGVDTDRLIAEFGLSDVPADHVPRYNIAPTQPVAAVVRGPDGLRIGWLRWGLIPGGGGPSPRAPLINARSETASRLPAFRDSFRLRRCWILADGFYEWKRETDGSRVPYHIRLPDGRPFAFAGIWDRAEGPDGDPVVSCAILTTSPSAAVAAIHDRMPVLLPPALRGAWLDPATPDDRLAEILAPSDLPLEAHRVSTRVNAVANDDPSCRDPLSPST